jgi:hypothetical protein
VFIGDFKTQSIIVFNEEFEFIREIGEKIQPFYIQYDEDENTLLVSDRTASQLSIFEAESGRLVRFFNQIQYPGYFLTENNLIYVISGNKDSIRYESEEYRLYIIDKMSGEIENSFDLSKYLDCRGIYMLNGYIYITVKEYASEYTGLARKNRKYLKIRKLIKIDTIERSSDDTKSISLKGNNEMLAQDFVEGRFLIDEEVRDFIVIGSRLITCYSNNDESSVHVFDIQFS